MKAPNMKENLMLLSMTFQSQNLPHSGTWDESNLVQAAQDGNVEAFNQLVLKYQNRVFNLAYHLLGEVAAAEDAAQTTFLNAYQKLSTFRGGSFCNWLLRIVTNQCYDELRRQVRHPMIQVDPLDEGEEGGLNLNFLPADIPTPEQIVVREDVRRAVRQALQEVPVEYRRVVALVDLEGMSYEEAAVILRKPLGTIKSRLTRGRLKLREQMESYYRSS